MADMHWALRLLTWLEVIFICVVGLLVLSLIAMYITDKLQTKHTIRKNYPIIGRFRYFFEHLGEFFRQYFYAQDREEFPFNRADRSWVYRAAKNIDTSLGFGSTLNLNQPGTLLFLNSAFPVQEEEALIASPVTIGPYCAIPYTTNSIFNISGMSYGALSRPAILALSRGAAKAGCWLNTGEGGLSPYHLEGDCDLVFQIGTAKYGVRDLHGNLSDESLQALAKTPQIKMFELKLSQGAKPGKGGILPAEKVTAEVARIRGIAEAQASISPNGHTDIRTTADLLNMINHIRDVTGKPVGFKAVLGEKTWLIELIEKIKIHGIESAPDFITLDSADGGSGAAPQALMDHVGLPIKESLPWLVALLEQAGLKDRIKIIVAGKLITPHMVAWALASGADFVNSARGFMFALGCIQALQCHKNTCPTGITTHNPKLQKGLNPANKAERVAAYQRNMTKSVAMIAHSCGLAEPRQLKIQHVNIINSDGFSVPLASINPQPLIFTTAENRSIGDDIIAKN
jgi:glutamate synthase domain-containing protein 2